MTRQECEGKLEPFLNEYGGILLWIPENNEFVDAAFGDGSNLDSLTEGNNDYIYIEITRFDRGFCDAENCGIMSLNTEEDNFTYDITKWVYDILERIYFDVPDFVHIKTYSRQ